MKYNIFLTLLFVLITLLGCYSTYTINDFSSKEKFYEDFNNSVGTKDLNITLINDSLISIKGGGILKQDTLYTSTNVFPIQTVKNVNYKTRFGTGVIGTVSGLAVGLISASLAFSSLQGASDSNAQFIFSILLPPFAVITGAITGWFVGWNTYYQFNL
jgi:hypothetical protein